MMSEPAHFIGRQQALVEFNPPDAVLRAKGDRMGGDGGITRERRKRGCSRIHLLPRHPDNAPAVVEPGGAVAIEGPYCRLSWAV